MPEVEETVTGLLEFIEELENEIDDKRDEIAELEEELEEKNEELEKYEDYDGGIIAELANRYSVNKAGGECSMYDVEKIHYFLQVMNDYPLDCIQRLLKPRTALSIAI